MQRLRPWMAGMILAVCVACTGCGNSGGSAPDGTKAGASDSQSDLKDTRGPKAVLTDFFGHVRQRRFADAHGLLSKRAREVVEKLQIGLDPFRHNPSVQTDVVGVDLQQDGANVLTRWTMGDGASAQSIDIRWIMRRDAEGWRIIGTIGTDPQGQPVRLNFEDEAQMRLTQQEARQPAKPSSNQTSDKPPVRTAKAPTRQAGTP